MICWPDNPSLARSVFNRFPTWSRSITCKVELLRRYRSGENDELVQRGILLTMNGLASALRNSGWEPMAVALRLPGVDQAEYHVDGEHRRHHPTVASRGPPVLADWTVADPDDGWW